MNNSSPPPPPKVSDGEAALRALRLLLPSATATNGGSPCSYEKMPTGATRMPRGGQQGQVVQVAGAPAAAGAGTWEGKAGYPHMTRLPKWIGM